MSIGKGFADPVRDSQRVFRQILRANSNPGDIVDLGGGIEPPPGLPPAAAAVLLTLADIDTPIWMSVQLANICHRWLAFHSGAPLASAPSASVFAIVDASADASLPTDFNAGDDRYPDRSTTVIVLCRALDGGSVVEISGPGINGKRSIRPTGPAERFWRAMIANNALFPRGADVLLVAGSQLMALPRSLTLRLPERQPCT
jgi:alpha-D-ribose 1-methylphosphonate 5-triphosphate synthase subunit PhnH